LTTINKIYSDGRYNKKISEEYFAKIITEKCYNTARKVHDEDEDWFECDGYTLQPSTNMKLYQQILEKHVMKYINNDFEDKKWLNPKQINEVIKVTEDIIPPKITAELVNEITNKLIT